MPLRWAAAPSRTSCVSVSFDGHGSTLRVFDWGPADPGILVRLARPRFVMPKASEILFQLDWMPAALNQTGRLAFFGDLAPLAEKSAFDAALAPLRGSEWVVYAKRSFAGPKAVLAYLARYTHRVAISNSRLIALDDKGVTFKWKDYRIKGRDRLKTMTLDAAEFIRRFLLHVLPSGFHRIRHYGLFAGAVRRSGPQHRARPPIACRAKAPA